MTLADGLDPEADETAELWQPNPDHEDGRPNPQRLALECEADELYFGGAAGGGKTDLILGAALTEHTRAVIFRRIYPNLDAIEQRLMSLVPVSDYNQSRRVYNGSDCRLELESCQREKDKYKQQGRPRDFYGFDEITEFSKSIYQFIIGWNRTEIPDQRCRVIVTGNPPIDDMGMWVLTEWGPWLQQDHPHKAEPGELRWYYYDEDDNPVWLESPEPITVNGKEVIPKSRSFIPADLGDNPHYGADYLSRINSMPEPIRSALLGDFYAARKTNPWQVIPASWVKAAQRRWLEREEPDMPVSGVGVDLVRGGKDNFALSKRKGSYFCKLIKIPGVNVEDGPAAAGLVHNALQDEDDIGYINVDIIGIGSSGYDSLKAMPRYAPITHAVNAGAGSDYIAFGKPDENGNKQPLFAMRNTRAEYYWKMREALDPEHGDDIALPPGDTLVADLCAAEYKLLAGSKTNPPKIQIEDKVGIKKRLGRSPDEGEAVMMAHIRPNTPQPADWENYQELGTIDDYDSRWT